MCIVSIAPLFVVRRIAIRSAFFFKITNILKKIEERKKMRVSVDGAQLNKKKKKKKKTKSSIIISLLP